MQLISKLTITGKSQHAGRNWRPCLVTLKAIPTKSDPRSVVAVGLKICCPLLEFWTLVREYDAHGHLHCVLSCRLQANAGFFPVRRRQISLAIWPIPLVKTFFRWSQNRGSHFSRTYPWRPNADKHNWTWRSKFHIWWIQSRFDLRNQWYTFYFLIWPFNRRLQLLLARRTTRERFLFFISMVGADSGNVVTRIAFKSLI